MTDALVADPMVVFHLVGSGQPRRYHWHLAGLLAVCPQQ
jgi:hypothetical protein